VHRSTPEKVGVLGTCGQYASFSHAGGDHHDLFDFIFTVQFSGSTAGAPQGLRSKQPLASTAAAVREVTSDPAEARTATA
jgi:hypothetical protein